MLGSKFQQSIRWVAFSKIVSANPKSMNYVNSTESALGSGVTPKKDSTLGNAEAHFNVAVTLKRLGRFKEAEVSYAQAIAIKNDFPGNSLILGMLKMIDQAELNSYQDDIY